MHSESGARRLLWHEPLDAVQAARLALKELVLAATMASPICVFLLPANGLESA